MKCLVCQNPIAPFLDFGKMPIANGFLTQDQFSSEYFYDLSVAFCDSCYMVQLTNQPHRHLMFHDNYAFYSSTSKHMAKHFEKFAEEVIADHKPSFVIELGSNDGIMLRNFNLQGIRHLGIEPSENVAKVARENGVDTISCFFDEKVAKDILEDDGQADVILAANVLCHISDIHSVIRGIKTLLKPGGVLIFEDPYLGDILAKTSYDQIYDEHAFYFSASSVSRLFKQYGMEIINVQPQETHGGSMRYTIAKEGIYAESSHVNELLTVEYVNGFHNPETYDKFRRSVEASRDSLITLLKQIKLEGGNIVGYGATSKSTTITNYCGIGRLIDFICDTTPIKQGKYSPGVHLPVRPYQEFLDYSPTHALLFAWNHSKEIMEKEKFGGKWITYVPEVKIL